VVLRIGFYPIAGEAGAAIETIETAGWTSMTRCAMTETLDPPHATLPVRRLP